MKIFIINDDDKYTGDFLKFVIEKTRELFLEKLNKQKLQSFEIFINKNPKYNSLFKKYIPAYEICYSALYNLHVKHFGSVITIEIDSMINLPNTSIKLIELVELIDKGNLVLKAYPIFTEVFKEIEDKIENLYAEFILKEEEF